MAFSFNKNQLGQNFNRQDVDVRKDQIKFM
jgi:hypothetical protein